MEQNHGAGQLCRRQLLLGWSRNFLWNSRLITVFTGACYLSLSWENLIHFTLHLFKINFSILPSMLDLPHDFFPSDFLTTILYFPSLQCVENVPVYWLQSSSFRSSWWMASTMNSLSVKMNEFFTINNNSKDCSYIINLIQNKNKHIHINHTLWAFIPLHINSLSWVIRHTKPQSP
jgi:hypothetical protein